MHLTIADFAFGARSVSGRGAGGRSNAIAGDGTAVVG